MKASDIRIPDCVGPMPEFFIGAEAKGLEILRVPGKGPFDHAKLAVYVRRREDVACVPCLLQLAMFVEN